MMWWGGGWWFGAAFMIICMLLMARMMMGHGMMGHGMMGHGGGEHGGGEDVRTATPEHTLANRLASGEIDVDEYERLLEALRRTDSSAQA